MSKSIQVGCNPCITCERTADKLNVNGLAAKQDVFLKQKLTKEDTKSSVRMVDLIDEFFRRDY